MRQIVDVADILSGNAWKSANFSSDPSVGLPVIRIQNVSDTKTDFVYWDGEPLDKYIIKNGDLLLSLSGNVKLCQWQYGEALLNQRVVRLSPRAGVDTRYFYWSLRRVVQKIEALAKHAVIANVSVSDLKSFEIPLPPLTEQKRIANILDKADAIRHKRQQAIQLADEFLRAVFLDMFGDPVTNPKGWEVETLSSLVVGKLQNGAYFPKEKYSSKGVEMVHMADAFYDVVPRGQLKRVNASAKEIEKYGLGVEDIMISRRSLNYEGAAKPTLIPESSEPLIFESSMIRLTPNPELINKRYLFQYLSDPSVKDHHVRKYVTGATIKGISQKNLEKVEVLVPPLDMQRKFEESATSIERFVAKHSFNKSMGEDLFLSISQNFLC
ncbi:MULTISPECIES: restriction endonuclease subunit S [unclassified Alcanivorax]|nr:MULTISPECIES: restriction endonuclease subunit S [unclassified Alcanivorax]